MNIEEIKNRYLALYPSDDGVDMQNMIELEQSLNMKFPKDFFEISQFYSGGQLGDVSLYSFNINEVDNILEKTFLLRKTNKLPNKFIVLAEPDESLIVMDMENKPRILWINSTDIDNLSKNRFEMKPDIWQTFSDFFIQLLKQEEEDNLR